MQRRPGTEAFHYVAGIGLTQTHGTHIAHYRPAGNETTTTIGCRDLLDSIHCTTASACTLPLNRTCTISIVLFSMSNLSTDQFFVPGSILTLFLTVDQAVFKCNATILKPFIPFTKSQVLLVELQPHISGIPFPVILKVYNPYFINDHEQ